MIRRNTDWEYRATFRGVREIKTLYKCKVYVLRNYISLLVLEAM